MLKAKDEKARMERQKAKFTIDPEAIKQRKVE